MSDLTKCTNQECPKKESCLRFTAPAKEFHQSYQLFLVDEKGACAYYRPVEEIFGAGVEGFSNSI